MPKQIKQVVTVAKYNEGHDRLSVIVKFANGDDFRVNSSRYRDSCSTKVLGAGPKMNDLFKFCLKYEVKADGKKENNGDRFRRVAKWFEQFASLEAALAAC